MGCMHMSNMCVPGGVPTHTPDSVHTMLDSLSCTSHPTSCMFLGFFCPNLGIPPVVCHTKIAHLLLLGVELNSAAHCAVMGGRGVNRS